MTLPRGQARPSGRNPRIDGDPILPARPFSLTLSLLAAGLLLAAAAAAAPQPRATPEPPPPPEKSGPSGFRFDMEFPAGGERDSLMQEILHYRGLIGDLRDSLSLETGELHLAPEDRARLEKTIGDFSKVIEEIGAELSRMDFEVSDNTISLLNERGKGIVITIPDNLDDQLSQGLEALSEFILTEVPDTVRADAYRQLSWLGQRGKRTAHLERKVVQGNVIKVWDDLLIPAHEDVRGHVVVVFGNSEIQGKVDGNVVVVLGNLELGEDAEVRGRVVTVGGRLDQDEGASASDVFVLDPSRIRRALSPAGAFGGGIRGFLVCQSLFLVMLAVAVCAALIAPARRFAAVQEALRRSPSASLGLGVLTALAAHLVVLILVGVLVLTVIGIPLALLVWLALAVGGVIATAVAAAALGERLCRHRADGGCPSRWLAVLVGMVLLHALSFLGFLLGTVPGLGVPAAVLMGAGALVKLLAYFVGVGALAISRFGSARGAPANARPTGAGEFSSVAP